MILPIVAYGNQVLKRKAGNIDKEYPELDVLIKNMWETMYAAKGVGLASPQIGLPIRLFVIDTFPFSQDDELSIKEIEELNSFKEVFINAEIIQEEGELWSFNEGCLSIPDIREDIFRKKSIKISYYDQKFNKKELTLTGIKARVVQHEYDHIDGVLFTDHLSPLKKRILKGKLNDISKGKINTDYLMKFNKK
jgi:peptide deformylase